MKADKEELLIREMLNKSDEKMPFPDFEDKLMDRINKESASSKTWLKDIRLSWFFFLLGTLLGLIISFVFGNLHEPVYGIPPRWIIFIVESVCVVLLLSQFERLIEMTKKKWQ